MTETTILSIKIHSDADDFDIRREFCGFQDERLNDLRQFTSCIIDLRTHGTKDPFENVTWVISHYDEAVRAFVVKRIHLWAQTTQIAARMHTDDLRFHQQMSSDSSSGSIDIKVHQLGSSVQSTPSPPSNSVPLMIKKNCKTPSQDRHFGSIPNAALVPQTDIQSRYQQRRRRNSSSSSSTMFRPALFGKPSDSYFTRPRQYPPSRRSPLSTPISKMKTNEPIKLFDKSNFGLVQPVNLQKEYSCDLDKKQDNEHQSYDTKSGHTNYEGKAKWANLLSDTSDTENDSRPLLSDIILICQLRDCLVHSKISATDDFHQIRSVLPKSFSIITDEKLKTLHNEPVWFYRLILNSKIILSNGVHKSKEEAEKLAWKKMFELITHERGVEPKLITNGRLKVVLRKAIVSDELNEEEL